MSRQDVEGAGYSGDIGESCLGGAAKIDDPFMEVGAGQGDYGMRMVNVGPNNGTFIVTPPQGPSLSKRCCACWTAMVSMLSLVMLGMLFDSSPSPILTTTTTSAPILANCFIWGDPHVIGFDGAEHNFLAEGNYWLFRETSSETNGAIWVQGKLRATPFTNGFAATVGLAVGGPGMQGHTVHVGTMADGTEGLRCDGLPFLDEFPNSVSCGPQVKVTFNFDGEGVDKDHQIAASNAGVPRRVVHIVFTADSRKEINIEVMRWTRHLNARVSVGIGMQTKGACGNNDRDPRNDRLGSITGHGHQEGLVAPRDSLFRDRNFVAKQMPRRTLADCGRDRLSEATQICTKEQGENRFEASGFEQAACIFDVCFGGAEFAPQDQWVAKEREDLVG